MARSFIAVIFFNFPAAELWIIMGVMGMRMRRPGPGGMRKVREGLAEILVPRQSLTRKAEAFYNPDMEYQRDLTMSALRVWQGKPGRIQMSVCDPLAGTGVRSVRIGLEVPGVGEITINDANKHAVKLVKHNLEINRLPVRIKTQVFNESANRMFLENPGRFDFIDIDPFGSPIRFVESAGVALKQKSLLACTATDTGALCGSFPSTCIRRYGIRAVKTDFFKEIGIRVLATATMTKLSMHGLAFRPLYSHANHYFRVMGEVIKSKRRLSVQSGKISMASYCPSCLYRSVSAEKECPGCKKHLHVLGPLWTGSIKDTGFAASMLADLRSRGYRRTKELDTCAHELDVFGYYELPKVFRSLRQAPVRTDTILNRLIEKGFQAGRTSLSDTGIRTNAPHDSVLRAAGI